MSQSTKNMLFQNSMDMDIKNTKPDAMLRIHGDAQVKADIFKVTELRASKCAQRNHAS